MTDPTLDAERLAAMLDGRLGSAEREDLVRALAGSDDALDVYADAAAVLRELETPSASDATPPAVPERSTPASRPIVPLRTRHWRALALAAAIVLAVATPLLWRFAQGANDETADPVTLLADGERGLPTGWNGSPWTAARGTGTPITTYGRAVRIGVRLTDLSLAIRGRDGSAAAIAEEIAQLLGEMPATGPATAAFRSLASRAGAPPAELLPSLEQARESALRFVDPVAARTGSWLEAARLAAARRDTDFFRHDVPADIAPHLADGDPALRRLHDGVAPASASEWDALAGALVTRLAALAR